MITLKKMAEDLGMSITTISRVLNSDKNISVTGETRNKIWDYAMRVGYRKEYRTKNKSVTANNKNIGYISSVTKEKFDDHAFSLILHGIEQEIIELNHNIVFNYSSKDLEDKSILYSIINSTDVNGVIIMGKIPDEQYDLITKYKKVVITPLEFFENEDCVTVDLENGSYQITKMLIDKGHTHIAYIGGGNIDTNNHYFMNRDKRLQGYYKCMLDHRFKINNEIIKIIDWDIEQASKSMNEILESKNEVTAVVVASDKMAIGVMNSIWEKGLKVPDDISITGFDNMQISEYINPSLTTVDYSKENIGREAVRLLIEKVNNENTYTKKIILPVRIIERNSVSVNR